MFYYLSDWLSTFNPNLGLLFRYITVRTMMAMLTSFIVSLLVGRWVILLLYKYKIRDVVRDYTVMRVESKKGTPTMGGVLILTALLSSVLLWANLSSAFIWYLLFAAVWFAGVGAADDALKIKYRDSDKGLSRKAKYALQIGYGLIFGLLFLLPSTTPLPHPSKPSQCRMRWSKNCDTRCRTDQDCQTKACGISRSKCVNNKCQADTCQAKAGGHVTCNSHDTCLNACGKGAMCSMPWRVELTTNNVTTFRPSQLYVPFLKTPLISFGGWWWWLYIFVVIFFIVYAANAVNFADGLDGLTTVPTMFSYAVYGIYAYILGNAILSQYLLFPRIPGAGEIAVFCGAVVGALVGFLWFNAYPAEVFMGDTGSMALGGVLGTMMVLLKQEVLFFLLGGIFLVEIASVAIQDYIGIKLLGRRIFYRAPIHHTYQHQGLAEPKIVIRFWIVAGVLALLSLAALKIR